MDRTHRTDRSEWIEQYADAWREKDPEALRTLFAHDAVYHSSPTARPLRGHEEITTYWKQATHTQSELDLVLGVPLSQGNRTVVEWWATLRDPQRRPGTDDDRVTLPGCLVLRFDDAGRCDELWEYVTPVSGEKIDAPPGWGV
ncbi:nuclear transport factor 2 family protein [Kineosporia sp. J2-2]|uniref:Nuclear transport factor 2 family protein n=1 Tax=Kineosporia corallincola TaxID=2835133 RepID=A0ABS5TSC8_9ACTN|nr:nuclear transport factor 2 family protein [Kineosporia corallincola]MBT0773700.1 nuclear transport factor 2 family protein [Kineosporia corallincola]